MRTVIQVWTHTCKNMPQNDRDNFWGLGDILRGTLKTYQLCKKYNLRFIVDIQLHNLSNYLVYYPHEYENIIGNNKDNIEFIFGDKLEEHIVTNKNELLYFFTTAQCEDNLDDEAKNFMKNILTPNCLLAEYIYKKSINIPDNYNILHYRLGDEELVRKNSLTDIHQTYLNHLKNNVEDNDILLSDSRDFKKFAKSVHYKKLIIFDTEPKHIGYESTESMNDTLFEFFIITKSKKIKTYSRYGWISGFVFWAHKVYDIPLQTI